jgi:glyoxylase-like metal-dependent hydrolase (beta-lactamase superfamily II)
MQTWTHGGEHAMDWLGDGQAAPLKEKTFMRLRTRSRIRSVLVGEIAVTYLPDGMVPINPVWLYPEMTEKDWSRNYPEYLDSRGYLTVSSGALLIENGDRAMLLDAGYGPFSPSASRADSLVGAISSGELLASLASAGRKPEDIEAIAFSHLRMDHVGWAALPRLSNPFWDATCLVHEPEWRDRESAGVSTGMLSSLEARAATVADGEEIFPGVRVQALPGHTQGHAGFRISSLGQELIAFGDVMYSPYQAVHPELKMFGDSDYDSARQSRFQIVAELAATGKIGYGCHFADVVFGRVQHTGTTMAWIPLP